MSTEDSIKARVALKSRSLTLAEQVASDLRSAGFRILNISDRGVSFEGAAHLFQSEFQSPLTQTDSGWRFTGQPVLPDSCDKREVTLYFPTRPDFV